MSDTILDNKALLQEAFFSGLTKQISVGIFSTDQALRITSWNPWLARHTGVEEQLAIGESLEELFPTLRLRGLLRPFEQALQGQSSILSNRLHRYLIPATVNLGGGIATQMIQSASIFPLLVADEVVGTIVTITDVTEQVVTEEALREKYEEILKTNREMEAFVKTVSHDLASPVTYIAAASELLESIAAKLLKPEDLELLTHIGSQARNMHNLVQNLLELMRVGQVRREPERVVVDAVAQQVAEVLQEKLAAKGGELVIEPLPELICVPGFVYQVLLNLIGNAIRYAAAPGKPIVVGGERTFKGVRLFVRDHGPGIAKEERERIFESFYRGAQEYGAERGSGLGLTIVQKLALLHGGRCYVEETPGGGATFWIEMFDATWDKSSGTSD